ncbi:MAG: TonB-dependent receptor [Saprospiraceae bacterium]
MKIPALLCAVWLLLLFPDTRPLMAQQPAARMQGIVRDAENGEALAFVNIALKGASQGATTNPEGYFSIEGLAPGTHTLIFSYLGYGELSLPVEVLPEGNMPIEIRLEPMPLTVAEVVVTAGARAQATLLTPASIGVITAKNLRERSISTFDQAFDEMPGVVVTRSSGANVQAFSIRGASEVAGGGIGNRVLLLIDGRPSLSPESGGALWNLVPISSVERIEVVRGPYSSLYGSSAMGGVVNVITRQPGVLPETRLHLNYGAYGPAPRSTGYRRYGDFHAIEISHSRKINRFSYLLDGSWKSDGGHREKSAFDLYNFFAKTTWEIKPGHSLQFSANANRMYSDAPATWLSHRQAYSVADFKQDDYQDRREFNADLLYKARLGERLRFSSRVYHYRNYSLFSFDSNPGNDSTNVNTGKQIVKEYSVKSRRFGNITQADLTLGRHELTFGADVKLDDIEGLPEIYLYGRHKAFGGGAYIQDEISLGTRITATAGARFDHYRIYGAVQESNFSPKLAVLYRATPRVSVRSLIAQAFRDPPIAERFIKFEQGGGLAFEPNPNLKPERLVLSAESGAKWSLGKSSTFDIAVFHNRYKNLISFQQVSAPLEPLTYKVVNLREALMQGVEFNFQQRWKDLLLVNFSYTFLDARDISPERVNDALAYKVRHTIGASATLTHGKWMLHTNARYRSRIEEVFIYPGNEPEAVFVANTKLRFTAGKNNFYVAVNNLNNAQYEELERYRMPGRSFLAGMEFSF